ncbi:hypothetical protein PMG11_06303 [Penicillium brasilianum]|uniref:Uncharacterized protein n=1 Tax=Penicillium brasilianum TaxID=104259 RepID=A0A0F7TQ94_PENBI|nr:hypothetical protein PMG11_06303 [Penicillium brasilianum]
MSPEKPLDARWYDKRRKSVLLSNADLEMLFHPALIGIAKALQRQIEQANHTTRAIVINKIILVGGFSLSPYLYRNLQQLFGSSYIIHRPDKAMTAMALGAVLCAYRPRTRLARCHYGFQGPDLTDESSKNKPALVAVLSGLTSQANQLCWVIKKVIPPWTGTLDGAST